jgi:hypothetical protein
MFDDNRKIYEKNYSDKDWKVIRPYMWFINRALWHEVIPSLREVIMDWDNEKNTICFYFYHDGPVTEAVEEHYRYIARLAHFQGLEIEINMEYKVIRLDYPELIPQREFVIYSRKEPFVDPVDDSPPPKGQSAFYRESYDRDKPLPKNIKYTENDWEIIRDFRWYVNRALWGEVIPSLRQVNGIRKKKSYGYCFIMMVPLPMPLQTNMVLLIVLQIVMRANGCKHAIR